MIFKFFLQISFIFINFYFSNCYSMISFDSRPMQFKQVRVLRQVIYQNSADTHPILQNQYNLCGLFALFNVEHFMNAMNNELCSLKNVSNEEFINRVTQELGNVINFNSWIQERNKSLSLLKSRNSQRLGDLKSFQIQGIARDDNFLIIDFINIQDQLIFSENIIIEAIHRFRDTGEPLGIIVNIDNHWIALVITKIHTWIMDSLNTSHLDDQGAIKNKDIDFIDKRFRSDSIPRWSEYLSISKIFKKADSIEKYADACNKAYDFGFTLNMIEVRLNRLSPYKSQNNQKIDKFFIEISSSTENENNLIKNNGKRLRQEDLSNNEPIKIQKIALDDDLSSKKNHWWCVIS